MPPKTQNYNYALLFYDVNERRVQKVFKVCKKYLSHFQYSVFRGDIIPSKLIRLENDLKKVINEQEDFVCIIKLKNDIVNIGLHFILKNVRPYAASCSEA